jgi:hypothetical protein
MRLPQVLAECERVLDRDPRADTWTSFILLALEVAWPPESAADMPHTLCYIQRGIRMFESDISVDSNLRAYTILLKWFPNMQDEYEPPFKRWLEVRTYRDLQLLGRGEFFRAFYAFCESLRVWDLPLDGDWDEVEEARHMDKDKKQEEFHLWSTRVRLLPAPIHRDHGRPRVSSEFLRVGNLLLSQTGSDDHTLNSYRAEVEVKSREGLGELLDLVVELEAVPAAVKSVIRVCRAQLEGQAEG